MDRMTAIMKHYVILFDLDGTLLPWDTQALFLNYVLRKRRIRMLGMIPWLLALPLYAMRVVSETTMKRLFLCYLWRMRKETLATYAHEFSMQTLTNLTYEANIKHLREYLADDAYTCVLVTASPDLYAHKIGQALGFEPDCIIATTVALPNKRIPFFPRLPHGNNKGQNKVSRLQKMGFLGLTLPMPQAEAWSDSSADTPMLTACARQILVNPSKKLMAQFPQADVVQLDLPYKSWISKSIALVKQFLGIWQPDAKIL